MTGSTHVPVLLEPVLDGLGIREDGLYVDGTFGRGGHSRAILDRLGENGRLIAIDRDPAAIASAPPGLTSDTRFELVRGDIAQLGRIVRARNGDGQVDGILFDLGVSSPQLDEAERGFSFLRDGPLDMRMDPDHGEAASDWLARVDEKELVKTLKQYGEEREARRIARAIVSARARAPITRTTELAGIVEGVVPRRDRKIHPATRTFQAIRIAVNDELGQLETALTASVDLLRRGGRLCVISFHSLEDRLVKRFMRDASREPEQYRGMPSIPDAYRPKLRLVGKAIAASEGEVEANVRSRSARLRIAEKAV